MLNLIQNFLKNFRKLRKRENMAFLDFIPTFEKVTFYFRFVNNSISKTRAIHTVLLQNEVSEIPSVYFADQILQILQILQTTFSKVGMKSKNALLTYMIQQGPLSLHVKGMLRSKFTPIFYWRIVIYSSNLEEQKKRIKKY